MHLGLWDISKIIQFFSILSFPHQARSSYWRKMQLVMLLRTPNALHPEDFPMSNNLATALSLTVTVLRQETSSKCKKKVYPKTSPYQQLRIY